MATVRSVLATTCLLAASSCAADVDGQSDGKADPAGALAPRSVTVTLDDLRPGWRVTTSRLLDHDMPDEHTISSDGSPITLAGTDDDVFAAAITDASGALIAMRSMTGACTLASSRQLRVPGDHPTIQAAIDAAAPGDIVKVAAGTYTESVALRPGVCLIGSGARGTILDARGEGRTLVDLTNAPGSVVAGFTLRGVGTRPGGCATTDPFGCSGDWYTAGIYVGNNGVFPWDSPTLAAPPIVVNNVFESNYIGMMLYFHSMAVVRNNVFSGNRNGFVANHHQDRTLVANNVFIANTDLAIGNQAAYLDIIDNFIVGSRIGIRFQYDQTGHIACNVFHGNGANADDPRVTIGGDGNIEADPRFAGAGDYHLQPTSPGRDAGCHRGEVVEPDGTPPDIGAFGGPLAAWVAL